MKATSFLLQRTLRPSANDVFLSASGRPLLAIVLLTLLAAALLVASARAELFVLNSAGARSQVLRFDPASGAARGAFQADTEAYYSLTVSVDGELCVVSNILGYHTVQRFDRTGRYLGNAVPDVMLGLTHGTRGPDGNVYALAQPSGDAAPTLMRYTGPKSTVLIAAGSGGMTRPSSFVFGPDGKLYVADAALGVLRFDPATGAPLGVFVPLGSGGLRDVARMTFGPDRHLYVTSEQANAVLRFDGVTGESRGTFVAASAGGMRMPCGLTFADDGHLYVVSTGTNQVLRFDGSSGAPLGVAAAANAAPGDPTVRWRDLVFLASGERREHAWFDDDVPAGAVATASDGQAWTWIADRPTPASGTRAHRAVPAGTAIGPRREHAFNFAANRLSFGAGDVLYADVYLDGNVGAGQVMISVCTDNWEQRAYWGEESVKLGTPGTASRRYLGPLPARGRWQRLEVPARLLGLEGRSAQGISFTVSNTDATFDQVGRVAYAISSAPTPPPPTSPPPAEPPPPVSNAERIWFDDALPAGAVAGANGGDTWRWITTAPAPKSGTRAHQSALAPGLHEHFFDWAYAGGFRIDSSETLFAWVYLDPVRPPRQIMLSFRAATWEHRAYWGENLIGYGTDGTASRRRIGDLPTAGGWVRLTVPASAVGLADTTLLGLSFSAFDGRVTWDAVGALTGATTPNPPPAPEPLPPNPPEGGAGVVVWMEGGIPAGAWTGTSGGDQWLWVTEPAPPSGTRAHQSASRPGLHEHFFTGAATPLTPAAGEALYVAVYLDPAAPPRALMVSWFAGSWEHRAYWGEDRFPYGTNGTASRHRVANLPSAGGWVTLQVPAAAVDLVGRAITGMSFSLYDGRATWDTAGKVQ